MAPRTSRSSFARALLLVLTPGCFSPNAAAETSATSTTGTPVGTGASSGEQSSTPNPATTSSAASTTSQSSTDASGTTDEGSRASTSGSSSSGSSSGRDTGGSSSDATSTGATPVSFEGDYEGIILGECQQFPTGIADVDGSLAFSIFEDTAISGSADLTVPYSDNTVPLTGTINGEGTAEAIIQVSGSVSCTLVGNAVDGAEITGTFTCEPHDCDGLWSASAI